MLPRSAATRSLSGLIFLGGIVWAIVSWSWPPIAIGAPGAWFWYVTFG